MTLWFGLRDVRPEHLSPGPGSPSSLLRAQSECSPSIRLPIHLLAREPAISGPLSEFWTRPRG